MSRLPVLVPLVPDLTSLLENCLVFSILFQPRSGVLYTTHLHSYLHSHVHSYFGYGCGISINGPVTVDVGALFAEGSYGGGKRDSLDVRAKDAPGRDDPQEARSQQPPSLSKIPNMENLRIMR